MVGVTEVVQAQLWLSSQVCMPTEPAAARARPALAARALVFPGVLQELDVGNH